MTFSNTLSRFEIISFIGINTLLIGVFLYVSDVYAPFLYLGLAILAISSLIIVRVPALSLVFYIALSIGVLKNEEGLNIPEITFYLSSLGVIAYTVFALFTREIELSDNIEKFLIGIFMLLPFAVIVGIVNGSGLMKSISEIAYFVFFYAYFFVKKFYTSHKNTVLFVIGTLLLFVVIRNLVDYQQTILRATAFWELETARASSNETFLVLSVSLCFSLLALAEKSWVKIVSAIILLLSLAALIITQSRGYWVATSISLAFIFFQFKPALKLKVIGYGLSLFIFTILVALQFFDEALFTALKGLSSRLETLLQLTSGVMDGSLKERVLETQVVWQKYLNNPIIGYGFGSTFTKKLIFLNYYVEASYVHNGFLAVLYKFGLIGFILFAGLWLILIKRLFSLLKANLSETDKIITLALCGTLISLLFVNITSPQTLNHDGIFLFTISSVFAVVTNNFLKEKPTGS